MKCRYKATYYRTKFILPLLLLAFVAIGCSSDSSGTANSGNGNGSDPPAFSSSQIGQGGTFTYTFEEEGTVEYYCDIHSPDMQGQVTVSSGAEISGQDTVEMINTQFSPSQITVAPNTEIIWINRDSFTHTVVEGNPSSTDNDGGGGGY